MARERLQFVPPVPPVPLVDRDPSDPMRRVVELAQRGRMILDVTEADHEAAEARLGPFHATTWFFRTNRDEALKAWDRLRIEFGTKTLEAAIAQPPMAYLEIRQKPESLPSFFVPIDGHTYHAQRVVGTALAPIQWRVARLKPLLEHGPYYVCRLREGPMQCDCAEWTYRVAEPITASSPPEPCKHVSALRVLGWI